MIRFWIRKFRFSCLALSGLLFLLSFPAEAQQGDKFARIGTLGAAGGSNNPSRRWDAFRRGLRELGYTEGKDIVIESRSATGRLNRISQLAAELVRLQVAVIVTGGASATQGAKRATSTIPIVMAQDNDPVGSGFVASLSRPGGNITGLARPAAVKEGLAELGYVEGKNIVIEWHRRAETSIV